MSCRNAAIGGTCDDDVIDEKLKYAGLRRNVEELRQRGRREVRMRPDALVVDGTATGKRHDRGEGRRRDGDRPSYEPGSVFLGDVRGRQMDDAGICVDPVI